jgi:hypothetical protein
MCVVFQKRQKKMKITFIDKRILPNLGKSLGMYVGIYDLITVNCTHQLFVGL